MDIFFDGFVAVLQGVVAFVIYLFFGFLVIAIVNRYAIRALDYLIGYEGIQWVAALFWPVTLVLVLLLQINPRYRR